MIKGHATEDKIVMEEYWYPFMYFCCEFLIKESEKNNIKNPYVIEFTKLWDEFIIRGNMERAKYSFKMLRLAEKYLSKPGSEYWKFDLKY